jgi:hypothetical protein
MFLSRVNEECNIVIHIREDKLAITAFLTNVCRGSLQKNIRVHIHHLNVQWNR